MHTVDFIQDMPHRRALQLPAQHCSASFVLLLFFLRATPVLFRSQCSFSRMNALQMRRTFRSLSLAPFLYPPDTPCKTLVPLGRCICWSSCHSPDSSCTPSNLCSKRRIRWDSLRRKWKDNRLRLRSQIFHSRTSHIPRSRSFRRRQRTSSSHRLCSAARSLCTICMSCRCQFRPDTARPHTPCRTSRGTA